MAHFVPVVSGLTGLGGYAAHILEVMEEVGRQPAPPLALKAVTSSNPARHPEAVAKLQANGVTILPDFDALLADQAIELVFLPLPIDLHLPFTEKALKSGKAVFCEKPAAGCVQDVDRMIALRDQYRRPVAIGFQDIYDPVATSAKRLILEGGIGTVRGATLHACWPRTDKYYRRADWAGRFRKGDAWVLDSPANNAQAHFLNIALFLLGPRLEASAAPTAIEAELYRANPIENFDTCCLRIALEGGRSLLACHTHACQRTVQPYVVVQGSRGQLIWEHDQPVRVRDADGQVVRELPRGPRSGRLDMMHRVAKLVRGLDDPAVAVATLEQSRCHMTVINGAAEAAAVKPVPDEAFQVLPADEGATLRSINGLEDGFLECTASGRMLHELGRFPWTVPAGRRDLRGYRAFAGPRT